MDDAASDLQFLNELEDKLAVSTPSLHPYIYMSRQEFRRLENLCTYDIDHAQAAGTNRLIVTVYTASIALAHARERLTQDAVRALLR